MIINGIERWVLVTAGGVVINDGIGNPLNLPGGHNNNPGNGGAGSSNKPGGSGNNAGAGASGENTGAGGSAGSTGGTSVSSN